MSIIPRKIRQYEFAVALTSKRTLEKEKELIAVTNRIRQSAKKIYSQQGISFVNLKNKIISDCRKFLSDELNHRIFSGLESEVLSLENTESEPEGKIISQRILEKLSGSLELKLNVDWLNNVPFTQAP